MPLVSVIVPVYKAEKWLHRCVDSILAQTMEDFELLLIDDGSPDRSGEICDEYAAKDSRVRVFHKENGGVSSARNWGLDNAQGEWISFVDADDWVEVDYLAGLTEKLDADFITGGLKDTLGNVYKEESQCFYNDEIGDFFRLHNADIFIRSTWGKLVRYKVIKENSLRFDEKIRFGEDAFFWRNVLLKCQSVRLIDKCGYIYYFDDDFLRNGKGVFDKYSLYEVYQDFLDFYWNTGMGNPPTYDEWLDWYQQAMLDGGGSYKYGDNTYFWQPVGDVWPLVVMLLFYAGYVFVCKRKQLKVNA